MATQFLTSFKDELINAAMFVLLSTETADSLVESAVRMVVKDPTAVLPTDNMQTRRFNLTMIKAVILILGTMLLKKYV